MNVLEMVVPRLLAETQQLSFLFNMLVKNIRQVIFEINCIYEKN